MEVCQMALKQLNLVAKVSVYTVAGRHVRSLCHSVSICSER